MRERGTVRWFNDDQGYGFIEREDADDLFVHFSRIDGSGHRTLLTGQVVEFEVGEGRKGPEAQRVRIVG